MKNCQFCGVEVSPDDHFCGLCGQTVNWIEAEKDVWSALPTTNHKSRERQYQSSVKETPVFNRVKSSYTTTQYDAEELYPTMLSTRSQMSEFPTSHVESQGRSPRHPDPKTPPVDFGPGMQPAARRRNTLFVLVTLAVASAVIISGVCVFLFVIKPWSSLPPHALVVTPSTLDFGKLEQGVKLALPVSISNTGGQQLSWTAIVDSGSKKWLGVQTSSATIEPKGPPQQDEVTVDTSRLPLGGISAYLLIDSNSGNAQVTVRVDVIRPGSPRLNIRPTILNFGTHTVATVLPQTILVINGGTMVLKWQVNAGHARWLTLDKKSSTIWILQPGGKQTINVAVMKGLTPGIYTATVTITSNVGSQHVPVSLVVIASAPSPGAPITPVHGPQLVVTPTGLTFSTVVQGTPVPQPVTVSNSGGQAMMWTAAVQTASGGSWLSIDTTKGTINPGDPSQPINVKVDATSLAPGTYSGTVTASATASGGGTVQGSPQTIAVTLTVTGVTTSGVLSACPDSTCVTSAPLPGATFTLLDSTGTPVKSVVTDGSGNYAFSNLALGSYTVSVTDSTNTHYIAGSPFTVSGSQTGVAVYVYPG